MYTQQPLDRCPSALARLLLLVAGRLTLTLLAADGGKKQTLDLVGGSAERTLRQFSEQSGVGGPGPDPVIPACRRNSQTIYYPVNLTG